MNSSLEKDIEAWEGEGGAAPAPLGGRAISMSGTANQVEWAERIKRQVNDEFDRMARSFRSVAGKQRNPARADTEAIVAVLEEKRAEVMGREKAGYFIHDWQEISDQVRQMIFHVVESEKSQSAWAPPAIKPLDEAVWQTRSPGFWKNQGSSSWYGCLGKYTHDEEIAQAAQTSGCARKGACQACQSRT